ncbi:hypothetical protein ALC60_02669 [Trachymyrmex zeteki]|uniref:Uncharacterized protein n=1 Tax=Mycetomoellerius zeteki TaxID=64791 RepID=A0A151XD27_9HYME|nr:hypothetical protein ALC60_02669 [Trachymyrmex zeteki]
MTLGKIRYAVFKSLSCNFIGTRGGERCSVRMPEVAREKSRRYKCKLGSYCILTISFGVYEPNIEEKLHPLMSQASWSLVTTGDGGGNEKCRSWYAYRQVAKMARPHSPLPLPLSQSATVPRKLERAPPFDPADSHPPSHPTTIHPSVDLTPSPMAPRSFPFPLPTKRIQLLPTVSFSATRYDISILAPCPRQHPFSRFAFPLFLSLVTLPIVISLPRMLFEDID